MEIHNVRLGLASNSSSTHSLIFTSEQLTDDVDGADFGWSYWTAASKEKRGEYAALQVYHNLTDAVGPEIALIVTKEWTGVDLPSSHSDWDNMKAADGYIDHQSVFILPTRWGGKTPHPEFVQEFTEFLTQDGLVIGGGNDNDSTTHHAHYQGTATGLPLPQDGRNKNWVCRMDEFEGSRYWSVFNRESGTKIRMSFNQLEGFNPTKATRPELVDIKITDYCPFGCAFCYMDSTEKGRHASTSVLRSITYALKDMEVFEVALGGGEPTLHPDFVDILKNFRYYGIVPNFTTKSLGWLRDDEQRTAILEHAGAFAYSATDAGEVQKLAEAVKDHVPYPRSQRVSVHYVLGTADQEMLEEIIKACAENHLRLTILGYKTVGRGDQFTPLENDWIGAVRRARENKLYLNVAIDTPLAAQYEQEILEAGISPKLFHTEEGKFSMYIDAVDGKMGASSFGNPTDMTPFDFGDYPYGEKIQAAFMQW